MTQRTAERLLWKLAALAGAAAVLSIALAVAMPLELPAGDVAAQSASAGPVIHSQADDLPSLEQLAKVWSLNLGHDIAATAPPPTASDAAPLTAPPDLHVIGTIIEPGHSAAMLIGPEGKTLFLHIGDNIQGTTITAIAMDSVTATVDGKPVVFKVEKPAPPPPNPKQAIITTPGDQ